jgi:hypothetical protein
MAAHAARCAAGGFPDSERGKTAADLGNATVCVRLDVTSREDRVQPVAAALERPGELNVPVSDAGIAGRVRARAPVKPLPVLGSLAGTAAFVLLAVARGQQWMIYPNSAVLGAGRGLPLAALANLVAAAAGPRQAGEATGMSTIMRAIGGSPRGPDCRHDRRNPARRGHAGPGRVRIHAGIRDLGGRDGRRGPRRARSGRALACPAGACRPGTPPGRSHA